MKNNPVHPPAGNQAATAADSDSGNARPELLNELVELFRAGEDADAVAALRHDDAFNRMALKVHAFQRTTNPALHRYWKPELADWQRIPPLPVRAFQEMRLASGRAEAVFRTSGTTSGGARRGEHHVVSLDLYRAASRGNYRRHLFGGEAVAAAPSPGGRLTLIALVPHPGTVPDSSLSAMVGFMAEESAIASQHWCFDPTHGLDHGQIRHAVESAETPILMICTAFALWQLLDTLADAPLILPAGSRIMETGGFKGRVAEVERADLHRLVATRLGISGEWIIGEYGMTELLSQAYDGRAGQASPIKRRLYRFPPWVRTRALNSADLSPLPPGETGLLAHLDLANMASVCYVLTEDLGYTTPDGRFRLCGRATGSDLRGCSLTAESFLKRVTPPAALP